VTAMERMHQHLGRVSQKGETIVGLMVGMVLSMVVILMVLANYKVSVMATANATKDVAADSQTTYAMVRASMAAQEAGSGYAAYGWTPVVPTHLHVLGGATFNSSTNVLSATSTGTNWDTPGNAIVWAWWDTVALKANCTGLLYDGNNTGTGGFFLLKSTVSCNDVDAANLPSLRWLATRISDRPANASVPPDTTGVLNFSITSVGAGNCKPFGLTSVAGSTRLTISAQNRSGATLQEQTCLINIP